MSLSAKRHLSAIAAALICATALFYQTATARDIIVYSQNGKHFSANNPAKMQQKCEAFSAGFKAADVTLFQEVQGKDPETVKASLAACVGPDKKVVLSQKYTGYGNNEYYAIAYDKALTLEETLSFDTVSASAFARPPLAIKLSDHGSAFWVADFHATFSSEDNARTNEALAMYNIVYNTLHGLSSTAPIIMGGDWNQTTGSPAFTPATFSEPEDTEKVCNNQENQAQVVFPNIKTSLNNKGELKSAYDHFAFDQSAFQSCNVVSYHGDLTLSDWWQVSDHVGIIGTFTLK